MSKKKRLYSPGTTFYGHTSQRSTCTNVMGREEHEEGNEVLMVSEVFWAILSAHIQPRASEPIGQRYAVHVDSDPKQPEYFFSTC